MAALIGVPEPFRFWPGGTSPSVSSFTLDATTDSLVFVFQLPEDVTISRFAVRQGNAIGTPPAFKGSIQGVGGDGNEDGTIKGGGSPASVVWTPSSGDNNTLYWKDLDNAYAGSKDEWLALVLARDSGTIDGSNNCSFGSISAVGPAASTPYVIQNNGGSRSRSGSTPLFAYGSTTRVYGYPVLSTLGSSFNSGSTPDERAVLFNIPTSACSTFKLAGARVFGTLANGGAFDLKLYDSDGSTVLQSRSFDADQDSSPTSARERPYYFGTPATLVAGTSYRLSFVPTTGSLVLVGLTVANDADMDAFPWGGAVASGSSRTDVGSWTDDPKTRYGINLIVSDLTPPAGGGSGYSRGRLVNAGGV